MTTFQRSIVWIKKYRIFFITVWTVCTWYGNHVTGLSLFVKNIPAHITGFPICVACDLPFPSALLRLLRGVARRSHKRPLVFNPLV
ncbi:MAG: hypothetical protein [Circular genetic element sp.]|nr:MAG: hypothetical protein [Circular genetic element sp.]